MTRINEDMYIGDTGIRLKDIVKKITKTYTHNGITFTFIKVGNIVNLKINGTTTSKIISGTNYTFTIDDEFIPKDELSTNISIGEGAPALNMIIYVQNKASDNVLYRTKQDLTVPFYPRANITYIV